MVKCHHCWPSIIKRVLPTHRFLWSLRKRYYLWDRVPSEQKLYQLNGIKKILTRNYGTTEEALEFFQSIQGENEKIINEFYTKPGKFAQAVKFAKSRIEWNPVQIPTEEIKKNPSKPSPAEQHDNKQAMNEDSAMNSNTTPSKQTTHDSAKACHRPNTVINLDLLKLALMSNEVALDYLKKLLVPYLDQYYQIQRNSRPSEEQGEGGDHWINHQ
jgi:hypothetical protein